MRAKMISLLLTILILSLASLASAETLDQFGELDTVYVEKAKLDATHWSLTVTYASDANIVGLSLPLKFSSGLNRLVVDSINYGDGVADFAYKNMRADTAIQCVTVGLIANITPGTKKLEPGRSRVSTIFVSSADKKPIEELAVDTTTTYPNNTLMTAADILQGTPPDTVRLTHEQQRILPAFIVTKAK